MTKFNVGDLVRIIEKNHGNLAIGTIAKVVGIDDSGVYLETLKNGKETAYVLFKRIELYMKNPIEDHRITALEQEVAELKNIVKSFKKPLKTQSIKVEIDTAKLLESIRTATPKLTSLPQSKNQERAAIIEKAKQILSKELPRWNFYQNEFVINEEKRTVVLLRKHMDDKKIFTRGIAKCHPNDVFNEDIGKIIAFGRATGYPTEEFEQAVQPDEVVVGMETFHYSYDGAELGYKKVIGFDCEFGQRLIKCESGGCISFDKGDRITNDTNADYK